jgi:uncharacterized RDD family membrane protein YckC
MPLPRLGQPLDGTLQYQTPLYYARAVRYAGFWRRVAAYFLDAIAIDFVLVPLQFILIGPHIMRPAGFPAAGPNPLIVFTGPYLLLQLCNILILWLYSALMESSQLQATLGKMALSIQVTDEAGQRITFGRATGRFFAKYLSALTLCIGFMMAGWTEKKQALHDIIASTPVSCKP